MPSGARVNIDPQKWGRVVQTASEQSTERATAALKRQLGIEVRAAGRVNTGRMADDWRDVEVPARTRNGSARRIYSPLKYTKFQNDGTRGSKPVHAKALRFSVKGGPAIFRMSSGPIAPAKFMERAYAAMSLKDWLPG